MNITKVNSVLEFVITDGTIKIDCKDFTITSYTGRIVKHIPKKLNANGQQLQNYSKFERSLLKTLNDIIEKNYQYDIDRFRTIETFLSFIELIDPEIDIYILSCCKMEKGLIKYLRENHLTINYANYQEFLTYKQSQCIPEQYREIWKLLQYYTSILSCIKVIGKDFIVPICKITNNQIKKNPFDLINQLNIMYKELKHCKQGGLNGLTLLDTNRDIEHNITLLKNANDIIQSNQISEQQNKYIKLNDIAINEFQVIVPTTLKELIEEGKQQNNCVGHYYNENIINGQYGIFFIRRINDLQHSLITCRFDVKKKKIVEQRRKNNCGVSFNSTKEEYTAIQLINSEVEKMLNEIL